MKQIFKKMKSLGLYVGLISVNFVAPNNQVFSQGAYLKLGAGYQASSNPSMGMSMVSNTVSSVTTSTYTTKNIGLGKGINFGAGMGYFFTQNLGAELGVNYLLGTKSTYTNEQTNLNANNDYRKSTNDIYTRMLFINPSFVLKIPMEKWNPYARVGVIMGVGQILIETNTQSTNGNSSSNSYTQEKTSGGMALGANGAFGVEYPLSSKINVFGEVSINSINYRPKKSEITESTLNGNDILNTLSTREKITEYENKFTEVDSGNPANPNNPNKFGRISMPLSNIGFQVGLSIRM